MSDPTAERLSAAGERVTRQRLIVADALVRSGRQLTATELYEQVRLEKPLRSLASFVGADSIEA